MNARVTFAAGMNYLLSGKHLHLSGRLQYMHASLICVSVLGLSGMFAYSWYAHKVISEFMDPNYKAKK